MLIDELGRQKDGAVLDFKPVAVPRRTEVAATGIPERGPEPGDGEFDKGVFRDKPNGNDGGDEDGESRIGSSRARESDGLAGRVGLSPGGGGKREA